VALLVDMAELGEAVLWCSRPEGVALVAAKATEVRARRQLGVLSTGERQQAYDRAVRRVRLLEQAIEAHKCADEG
jgi:hypothetical protein